MINLTNSELFEDLTSIRTPQMEFDLHNKYKCYEIQFDNKMSIIKFSFEPIHVIQDIEDNVCIIFHGVSLSKINIFLTRNSDSSTINNFYRGRFEKDGEALEFGESGTPYFYLEFEEGDVFELFAKSVLFETISKQE